VLSLPIGSCRLHLLSKNDGPIKLCVYFGLSKGEGEWPTWDVLTPKERKDPLSFCEFYMDLDEGAGSLSEDVVKSDKIIYDGVSFLLGFEPDDSPYGILVEEHDDIYAKVRPIIEFELTREVDQAEFVKLVCGTNYIFSPKKAEDPFYCEDWNGYTQILDEEGTLGWIGHLEEHKLYSGKVFEPTVLRDGISAKKLS
jgi:hypothetical protein